MRGKGVQKRDSRVTVGITPAYAGKRWELDNDSRYYKDHPRVCGEKPKGPHENKKELGSPPRMRGKALLRQCRNFRIGITPAYAGKRIISPCFLIAEWDHPRVCGEKHFLCKGSFCRRGSPPRMRGKASSAVLLPYSYRITPAYAGKRRDVVKCWAALGDHPRVCGEKGQHGGIQPDNLGSPPRMRGKVPPHCCFCPAHGITPAYAGKSYIFVSEKFIPEDHPRVCGEKLLVRSAGCNVVGSPPRMRGKGEIESYADECDRITPAYAGKSCR